jgi:hypothetical protein
MPTHEQGLQKISYSYSNFISTMFPGIIRASLFAILLYLIITEIFEFVKLRGFENPTAYCLFKLLAYSVALIFVKTNDSAMEIIMDKVNDGHKSLFIKLEEIRTQRLNNGTETEEGRI